MGPEEHPNGRPACAHGRPSQNSAEHGTHKRTQLNAVAEKASSAANGPQRKPHTGPFKPVRKA
eukprot:12916915-Alexandrium_andersonii.AAC.1